MKHLILSILFLFSVGILYANPEKNISLNHVGFTPLAVKTCILPGRGEADFKLIDTNTHEVCYTGKMVEKPGDFGVYRIGDFSNFQKNGHFYIEAIGECSYPFIIAPDVYENAVHTIIQYFSIQRCGASTSGYNTPCHVDDGYRVENEQKTAKHIDVSGGWHDASDLRKWVSATIYGLIGLTNVYPAITDSNRKDKILDEIKWGNQYFLHMQEPDGFIMNHCAGDVFKHGDQNRWTDSIVGNADDRLIRTEPCDGITQWLFIYSEAKIAQIFKGNDDSYSQTCLKAAERCFEWCGKKRNMSTNELGAACAASVQLFKATSNDTYKNFTKECAQLIVFAQYTTQDSPVTGFFLPSERSREPEKQIWQSEWPFLGLCDAIVQFPGESETGQWKKCITLYCNDYLSLLAQKNGYNIVPFGLYSRDPGGNRKIGNYWYRYFMEPNPSWWVGINAHLASTGIGLVKASRILDRPEYKKLAQHQLDWIMGNNTFNASTIIDIGYNQPFAFMTDEFKPNTPLIPGAVMNGIGGTRDDQPDISPGSYNTTEYWTPMVATTMWLMSELMRN